MSATKQPDVLQEWRDSAQFWEKHAQTIRVMFSPITRALIEEAQIREGDKILDVAAGPGEPSLTISEVVGPGGTVVCTDAIPAMLAAAEKEAQRRRLTNVEFRQCSADSLPFQDEEFDATVSRLGVMFFPDPVAGLREMLRVTKVGGAVSLAVWDKSELNPFAYVVTDVISRFIKIPPAAPAVPGAFRYAEPGALAADLRKAGAESVSERVLSFNIEAPISPAEFWAMRSETSGTLREKLMTLSNNEREEVAREVQEAVREFFPRDEMKFPARIIIVTANKTPRHGEAVI